MRFANSLKDTASTTSSTISLGSTLVCLSPCPSDHPVHETTPPSTSPLPRLPNTDQDDAAALEKADRAPSTDSPDGGQAWLVVLGGWCCTFCTVGLLNCAGVLVEYYAAGPLRHHDASAISWIPAVQAFLMMFASTICGRVFDNHGPSWLLGPGTAVFLLGLVAMSFCTEYYQFFLAQSVAVGLGSSAVFNASMPCVVSWFSKRRSTAYGVMATGGSVGGVVLPVMIDRLIRSLGFPWMVRMFACIFLALLAVACCTVRPRLPPRPRPVRLVDYFAALTDIRLATTSVAFFFFMIGLWLPLNFAPLQATAAGVPAALIPYLLPILSAASIFGRIIPGIAADHLGRFNIIIFIGFLSTLFCLAVWIPVTNTAGVVVFMVVFGFSSGAFISLSPTLIAQISDMSQIGTRVGTAYAIMSLGALVGSPVGGAIISTQNGNYLGLQLFCGLSLLASTCIFIVVRFLLVGSELSVV